jgi:hypothetical protein
VEREMRAIVQGIEDEWADVLGVNRFAHLRQSLGQLLDVIEEGEQDRTDGTRNLTRRKVTRSLSSGRQAPD